METIGGRKLWSFLDGVGTATDVQSATVRRDPGHFVRSYIELATKVAELQFLNRDYVFLFRGQHADYLSTQNNSSLKPALFRPTLGRRSPNQQVLSDRFNRLRDAETRLLDVYTSHSLLGRKRVERYRVLRWAILQHYEVCPTPLLDVTQSLRIAASFASPGEQGEGFVFVVGVPNLSGGITSSSEAGMQVIRLSSACPPAAVRPHIQEGFLLGEYPDLIDFKQKAHYPHYEVDMARRMVAKFRFSPSEFWAADGAFPQVERPALYPDPTADPIAALMEEVRLRLTPSHE